MVQSHYVDTMPLESVAPLTNPYDYISTETYTNGVNTSYSYICMMKGIKCQCLFFAISDPHPQNKVTRLSIFILE